MWLPMWVFDGNGFTMTYLAVWIRNAVGGLPQWRGGQERWMRRHPTVPVRISVATSGTDFTAPEADFAAPIRTADLSSWEITLSRVELQELGQRVVRRWRNADVRR